MAGMLDNFFGSDMAGALGMGLLNMGRTRTAAQGPGSLADVVPFIQQAQLAEKERLRHAEEQAFKQKLLDKPVNLGAGGALIDPTNGNVIARNPAALHNEMTDPSMSIKNFNYRQKLIKNFGAESPEVQTFDAYVRAPSTVQLGDRASIVNTVTATPTNTLARGVPPEEQPSLKGEQRQATEEAESNVKRSTGKAKAYAALQGFKMQAGVVLENIAKAQNIIKEASTATGITNAPLSLFPTKARELNKTLETIKANVGFDKLQQMRESSPTGGALGPVSDFENQLLQAVNGALDPMLKDQLQDNLAIIADLYPKVMAEREAAFAKDYSDVRSPGETAPLAEKPKAMEGLPTPDELAKKWNR